MIEWWRKRQRRAELRQQRQDLVVSISEDLSAAVRAEIVKIEGAAAEMRRLMDTDKETP